ncbi:unannotated protein [freshwater metagenome]|uniref:Unannotated protein n=1 Tax=freshwater metagenome TaxID=449393 RepID=A0A6J7V2K1_9ZZZZ
MRAVILYGKGDLRVEEKPLPKLLSGTSLVQITAAGICATDREVTAGRIPDIAPRVVLGHEITGVVVAGDESATIHTGDNVVVDTVDPCRTCKACLETPASECLNPGELGFTADGGWAEYVRVTTSRLHKVPNNLSWKEAVITEPFVIPFGALLASGAKIAGNRVLVVGGGLAGVAFASGAFALGADRVDVSLRTPRRREIFDSIDPNIRLTTSDLLEKAAADLSIDSVGNTESIQTAISGVKNHGLIVCYGFSEEFANHFPIADVVLRNLRLSGHTNSRGAWPVLIDLLAKGTIKTSGLVDRVISLDEVPDAVVNWQGNLRTVIKF